MALPCGHPDGAIMAGPPGDRCWACRVEAEIAVNAKARAERRTERRPRRAGNVRYPRRTIALGPPWDDGTIP